MYRIARESSVFLESLINMLEAKKQPVIVIDPNNQSVIYANGSMSDVMNSSSGFGTLIITSDEYNDNYHTRIINRLEYISECSFSFIPRDYSGSPAGVTFSGEFIRLHDVHISGRRMTIDIAGVQEDGENQGIAFSVICSLVTGHIMATDSNEKDDMLRFLNAIPLAACWKDTDGRFLGCNYRFEEKASDSLVRNGRKIDCEWDRLRMDMEQADREDRYVTRHKHRLGRIALMCDGYWASITKLPVLNPDSGDVMAITCIVQNISGQRLDEFSEIDKLMLQNVFMNRILSEKDEITIILEASPELPLIFMSDNASIIGLDDECIFNGLSNAHKYIYKEDADIVMQGINGLVNNGESKEMLFRIQLDSGAVIPVKARLAKVKGVKPDTDVVYGTLQPNSL